VPAQNGTGVVHCTLWKLPVGEIDPDTNEPTHVPGMIVRSWNEARSNPGSLHTSHTTLSHFVGLIPREAKLWIGKSEALARLKIKSPFPNSFYAWIHPSCIGWLLHRVWQVKATPATPFVRLRPMTNSPEHETAFRVIVAQNLSCPTKVLEVNTSEAERILSKMVHGSKITRFSSLEDITGTYRKLEERLYPANVPDHLVGETIEFLQQLKNAWLTVLADRFLRGRAWKAPGYLLTHDEEQEMFRRLVPAMFSQMSVRRAMKIIRDELSDTVITDIHQRVPHGALRDEFSGRTILEVAQMRLLQELAQAHGVTANALVPYVKGR
jgi:hypothetical protein